MIRCIYDWLVLTSEICVFAMRNCRWFKRCRSMLMCIVDNSSIMHFSVESAFSFATVCIYYDSSRAVSFCQSLDWTQSKSSGNSKWYPALHWSPPLLNYWKEHCNNFLRVLIKSQGPCRFLLWICVSHCCCDAQLSPIHNCLNSFMNCVPNLTPSPHWL